ncbi:MAG: amino acid permease, partial [Rhodospirillales bacterium]|nr:amino acid permease [Rhodospirillales bacterium]
MSAREKRAWLDSHEEGYEKGLKPRQIQMIAIGGAIGSGLFLGAGGRLQAAGPALAVVYAVCGLFSFFILRAMGELVMHRPTSGSFVSYAREFLGERGSFIAGWMYYLNWAMAGIVDITAVALYMHYWHSLDGVPQWVFALGVVVLVVGTNLVGVKWFGEMEFWFSIVKVAALVLFLVIGTAVLGIGHPVGGQATGLHLISENGGLFPHGVLPAIVITQGVVFAYAGIELVGTAAGEAENPRAVLPGAINAVIWRIALFYVGSVFLLVMLLPWTAYHAGTSPFVTFFSRLGVPGIGSVMNLVVLTAALSSLNSGLYSTGRVLRSLAMGGSAPRYVAKMNAAKVPYSGILVTLVIYAFGVFLNYLVPSKVFEIVLNISSLGVVSTWVFIVVCPNTTVSKLVYDWIAGVPATDDGTTTHKPGELELLTNIVDGNPMARPRTILIDSAQLESGEGMKGEFKAAAGAAITAFKAEYRLRNPGADVEKITDEELLREVMNTVGKRGRLGEHVRCVVSVSMLTEGWDANTVTHILGIRPFHSQLLCEQVVGRGLRRRSYVTNDEGRFEPEYANVYGIPFQFLPTDKPTVDPKPPKPVQEVAALEGREHLRISFPKLDGYRVELPDEDIYLDLESAPVFEIGPGTVPRWVEMQGVVGQAEREHGDARVYRPQEVAYALARRILSTRFNTVDDRRPWLFPRLADLCRDWVDQRVRLAEGYDIGYLMRITVAQAEASEKIWDAVTRLAGENRRGRLRPMINRFY